MVSPTAPQAASPNHPHSQPSSEEEQTPAPQSAAANAPLPASPTPPESPPAQSYCAAPAHCLATCSSPFASSASPSAPPPCNGAAHSYRRSSSPRSPTHPSNALVAAASEY